MRQDVESEHSVEKDLERGSIEEETPDAMEMTIVQPKE